MGERVFEFGFGDKKMNISLPKGQISEVIQGRTYPPVKDVAAAVKEALRNPIGSPPLKEIVKPGDKVGVVVSDITRAWVKFDNFLPVLLDELNAGGIPDREIFIVIGLGAHRVHTEDENVLVCGQDVCRRVHIYQHDIHNQEELAYIGRTSRGIETYINRRLRDADRMILTGGIVYHFMAGFGGGRKSIMPGISGFSTILSNHFLYLNKEVGKGINPGCAPGALINNEMHLDMCEMAEMAMPDFILNAVLTPDGKFAKFVAGHWYKAWEVGTRVVEDIYGVPISEKADLVVASPGGFPKDISFYQGAKTVFNASMACKQGGVIICIMECRDIYEPKEFSGWFRYKDIREFEMAIRSGFLEYKRADMKYPFSFTAYKCADTAKKYSIIVVTKPENVDFVVRTGMIAATSLDEAYCIAVEKLGKKDFTIAVMPNAADTVPIMQGKNRGNATACFRE